MSQDQSNVNSVGVHTTVTLVGFHNDAELKAKIDTGAECCSMDAQNIQVNQSEVGGNGTVSFTFGQSQYKMAINGYQAISSADGGTKNRPTVRFGVRIAGQYVPDVVFNLNDRSAMDFPVLVGVNLIQAAKLVVDPSLTEDMEISYADEDEPPADVAATEPVGDESALPDENVENSSDLKDNNENDTFDLGAVTEWFNANRTKTLEQIVKEFFKPEAASPINDKTE